MEKNKVLIVDDISENIKTISEMIKDFDIDVKTANGGKEAFNPLLKQHHKFVVHKKKAVRAA